MRKEFSPSSQERLRFRTKSSGVSMKILLSLLLVLAWDWSITFADAAPITITGQWDFKLGDLRATTGADLQYLNDTANITTFPVMPISGKNTAVMAFGANSVNQGFYMRHGADPNGGGQF